MATAKDVARLAGVAQSTVSYVMSGTRSISPETHKRVVEAMHQLDYHPNANAQALASNRSNVIGLVTRLSADITIASTTSFIETITAAANEQDHEVVLVTSHEDIAGIERLVRRSIIDAMVIMDIRIDDPRLETVARMQVPTVLIGLPGNQDQLECVDVDAELAGELACGELVADGCTQVVLIGEMPASLNPDFSYVAKFETGARRIADQAGVELQVLWTEDEGWAGHNKIASQVLAHRDKQLIQGGRTGVVGRTPQSIDGLSQVLLAEGVALGSELPLVGLCTDSYAESLRIPITNVSPEPREVSILAMKKLFSLLQGLEHETGTQLVAPRLTTRKTTRIALSG